MSKMNIDTLIDYYTNLPIEIVSVSLEERLPGMKNFDNSLTLYSGFIFPIQGKAQMWFDGTRYDMQPGIIVHGGPNMILNREVIGNDEWKYWLVLYEANTPQHTEPKWSHEHYILQLASDRVKLYEKLNRLHQYSHSPGRLYSLRQKELWYGILDEVFTLMRFANDYSDFDVFEQILDDVHQCYMEPLTLPMISERYQLTVNQLAYLFHKYVQISPGEYINQYRINQAKNYLRSYDSTLTIKDIAYKTGFSDPLYFSKRFKKYTGCSPSQYKQKFMNIP